MSNIVKAINKFSPRKSLAPAADLTDEKIKTRRRKHKRSKHLSTEPIQSEDLTYDQQEWLNFRMARPFPKPHRPHTPIEIPYKWIDTKTGDEK